MAKFVNIEKEKIQAVKKFTDREEPRRAFYESLNELKGDDSGKIKVLDFHGVGGIGKTALLTELEKTLESDFPRVKYIVMDFATVVDCSDTLEILRSMERMMRERYKFSFPLFDLVAYTYETKLGKLATRPELDSIVESNQEFEFLVNVMDEIPFVNTISKVIKMAGLARKGQNIIKERLTNRKMRERLEVIDKKTPQEIKKELGYYFAMDLAQNTKKLDEPFVVIFDTYELLVNEFTAGVPLDNDLFIRGPLGLIENTGNVFWVVSGREKLKWMELDASWEGSLECHKIGVLSYADAKWFLNEAGISDEMLVEGIYKITAGIPVYLDLCVDVYYSVIEKGGRPSLKDFGKDTKVLVNRFCTYMNDVEKDFIVLLAFLDYWTDETIEKIVVEKGGVFSPSLYEKIKDFSVISCEGDRYFVCAAVREVLIENAPATIRKKFEKDKVEVAKKAVKELNLREQHRFENYERVKKLKVRVRESYNALNKVDDENMEAAIMREYLAPNAMRIVDMVRKKPGDTATIDLLKYFIRFHEPNYDAAAYSEEEWEAVKTVAEKELPMNSLYLAKLYIDCPQKYEQRELFEDLANEILFDYEGLEKKMLVETIFASFGRNTAERKKDLFSPYTIHSMSRIRMKNAKMEVYTDEILSLLSVGLDEKKYTDVRKDKLMLTLMKIEKALKVLRQDPGMLDSRIYGLIQTANGERLGEAAQKALFYYMLEVQFIVKETTNASILINYAEMVYEFLGGVDNLPTSMASDFNVYNQALGVLKNIIPRYVEVFGKDSEVVAEMICYFNKHKTNNDPVYLNYMLGEFKKRYGIGSEIFGKTLRIVSIEYYNEFSKLKEQSKTNEKMIEVIERWTDEYLAVHMDEYIAKGYKELKEAYEKQFGSIANDDSGNGSARRRGAADSIGVDNARQRGVKADDGKKEKRVLASTDSASRKRLEAEAMRRQEKTYKKKHRFGLFGKK